MAGDSLFSSAPKSSQDSIKFKKRIPEPTKQKEESMEDFIVFLFFFDEAKGHLPLVTYPKEIKENPKELQTIKIHPIWWLPDEEDENIEPAVFEFGNRGYIAKKFQAFSKREKHRSGMDASTLETFVLAIGAPRDFIFLGIELLGLLYSRILSVIGEKLYILCERELVLRKPFKKPADKEKIDQGNQIANEIVRICRETLPKLSVRRVKERKDVQTRLQQKMAQLFLEDTRTAPPQEVRSFAMGAKPEKTTAPSTRKDLFKIISSESNFEELKFFVNLQNKHHTFDYLEDITVTISKVKGFFEIDSFETIIPSWKKEEVIRLEVPLDLDPDYEILIRISDENQSKLFLKKLRPK